MLWLGHAKLKSKDPEERRQTAEQLGQPRNNGAVQPLLHVLEDEDRGVREAAIVSLGKIGDFNATAGLVAALKRTDYVMVQAKAAISLGKIGNIDGIPVLMEAYNQQIEQLPVQQGSQEDKLLTGLLQVPEFDIKQEESQSVFLKFAAATALAMAGNNKAARYMVETLPNEKSALIRYQVASALKRFGLPAEVKKIETDLGVKMDDIISRAEVVLGDVGTYAVKAMETMLIGND